MIVSAIQQLQNELCDWADKTFGINRTASPVIAHLIREVYELEETPEDIMEYADCFILLLQAAKLSGYDTDDLIRASFAKMEINKNRKWGKPNADGSVEHIE
jgi:hypothetical protein